MLSRRFACQFVAAAAMVPLSASLARAGSLPVPMHRPVLSITGKIAITNKGKAAVFDLAMLEAMPQVSIHTSTPWYPGPVTFQGVPLTALMQAVGASGQKLEVHALDDFVSEIPVGDFAQYGPILAFKRDGKLMPISDKGPLFIVYPYDSSPVLKSEKYYSRSAWQIARIEVQ